MARARIPSSECGDCFGTGRGHNPSGLCEKCGGNGTMDGRPGSGEHVAARRSGEPFSSASARASLREMIAQGVLGNPATDPLPNVVGGLLHDLEMTMDAGETAAGAAFEQAAELCRRRSNELARHPNFKADAGGDSWASGGSNEAENLAEEIASMEPAGAKARIDSMIAATYADSADKLDAMAASIARGYAATGPEMREMGRIRSDALMEAARQLRLLEPGGREALEARLEEAKQHGAKALERDSVAREFKEGGVNRGLAEFARSVKEALGPLWDTTVDGPSAADAIMALRAKAEGK